MAKNREIHDQEDFFFVKKANKEPESFQWDYAPDSTNQLTRKAKEEHKIQNDDANVIELENK